MVSVIIVNWNTGRLLTQCLESLRDLPLEKERNLISRVLVVDNASTDDSLERAERLDIRGLPVAFKKLSENVGFSHANNLAWEKVSDSDHVWLLNPDTVVKPGALAALLAKLKGEGVSIVGPKLLNTDGSWQPSVRKLPSLLVFVWMFFKLSRVWPGVIWWREYIQKDFDFSKEQEVDQVMGAAFLINNSTWRKLGRLDDKFYLWFEEVDYCERVKTAGGQIWYVPQAEVIHFGAASFDQLVGWAKTGPFLKSSLRYARKHLGVGAWLALLGLTPISLLLVGPAMIWHIWKRKNNQVRLT